MGCPGLYSHGHQEMEWGNLWDIYIEPTTKQKVTQGTSSDVENQKKWRGGGGNCFFGESASSGSQFITRPLLTLYVISIQHNSALKSRGGGANYTVLQPTFEGVGGTGHSREKAG